jgi:phosphopantetheinyl transferase (holo-ACP synthase)
MIAGVGIDVVEIARLASGLGRVPDETSCRQAVHRERTRPSGLSHDGGVPTAVVIAEGGAD